MDQLLEFWFEGHTLFAKLLRLDASFVMMPRAAPNSHWILTNKFWGSNPTKLATVALGVFEAQPPKTA
jgi:hypothetical protein